MDGATSMVGEPPGGDGPEVARVLRSRLAGTALMWALAVAWSRLETVDLLGVTLACGSSFLLTLGSMLVLRRPGGARRASWVAEVHVAADLFLLPAFVWASGDWRTPFSGVLIVKGVGGSLVVGRRRGLAYAIGSVFVAWLGWLVQAYHRGGSAEGLAAPTIVALVCGALSVVVLVAAEEPLAAYENRRRLLARENQRLADTVAVLQAQNRELRALRALAQDLGTLGGVEEVALRLRDSIARPFPGYAASFFLFRRERSSLEVVLLAQGLDESRAREMAARDGVLTRALLENANHGPLLGRPGEALDPSSGSSIRVPLRLSEKPIGVLVLESAESVPAPSNDLDLLGVMAHEVAVALRNADLYARARDLRESVESMIENANALIFVVDGLGIAEVANRAFLEHVDPAISPLGRKIDELLVEESARELRRSLELVKAGSPVENLPLTFRGGAGGKRQAVFSLGPVYGEGALRGAIAVGQDITRLELLERELLQRQKLASLGEFVAGIAHEMNNPLTAITAYGSYLRTTLKGGQASADDLEKLEAVLTAGERIRGFVQSLLGFARPSAEEMKVIDLNAVIQDAVRLCRHDLSQGKLEVATRLAADLPPITGVEADLQQVFINLFTNAAQAVSGEGGHLEIRTARSGDTIRVTVQDDGPGIPPAVMSHIFDPFFSTKPEGKGTGLGLSIVKRVVERHHGRIDVRSGPGKGTTFTVDLAPAAEAPVARASRV